MKFGVFLFTILLLVRCSAENHKSENLREGFITKSTNYSWGNKKNVIVTDTRHSSKILTITDERGKVLYQQPDNMAFSDYHYWLCYVDDKENLYYYNSDYSDTKAILWNIDLNKYEEKDWCTTKINLPIAFKNELKDKTTLNSCLSLK